MKYASEDLIHEHEGILFGLKILEKMAQKVQENQIFEGDDLKKMVDFFVLFADKCHHGKEEGLMFPAMEKAGIPKENGPIGQMLKEHTEGRKYIAQMKDSLNGNEVLKEQFIKNASLYIDLLRAHIHKENQVLFPLGDQRIPMEEQHNLLEQFEEHEEKVMGKGTHEKLHELLHEFQNKYLKKGD